MGHGARGVDGTALVHEVLDGGGRGEPDEVGQADFGVEHVSVLIGPVSGHRHHIVRVGHVQHVSDDEEALGLRRGGASDGYLVSIACIGAVASVVVRRRIALQKRRTGMDLREGHSTTALKRSMKAIPPCEKEHLVGSALDTGFLEFFLFFFTCFENENQHLQGPNLQTPRVATWCPEIQSIHRIPRSPRSDR